LKSISSTQPPWILLGLGEKEKEKERDFLCALSRR